MPLARPDVHHRSDVAPELHPSAIDSPLTKAAGRNSVRESRPDRAPRLFPLVFALLGSAALLLTGCTTLKHTAVNKLGDALAAGGTTFSSDDDPELIRASAPFSLKMMESLLAETPRHRGLLLAAASGFTQYGYAFVQQDADELDATDVAAADVMRLRARRLFLRARDYGLRGLVVAHPDFTAALRVDPRRAVLACTVADVPLLYWTAAAWASAIAIKKDRPDLIAELPQMEALIDRAYALDETFDHGSIHAFLVSYEMARTGATGDPAARATQHFERAVALGPTMAGAYVALAEAVCIQSQQRARFESLLRQALAIDPDAQPESRLVNLIMQRRARWLLSRVDELFLAPSDNKL